MLNTAQFEGTGGWILKPVGYLPTEGKQMKPKRVTLDLTINILAAQGLGVDDDTPNAFVKCELHVESKAELEQHRIPKDGKNKGGEQKLRSAVRHSRDPDFGGEVLDFRGVQHVCPELSFLRYVRFPCHVPSLDGTKARPIDAPPSMCTIMRHACAPALGI